MSKSAGNVVLLNDVIEQGFDPLAVRLCLLENRYRSQMDLTWQSIKAADMTLKRWRRKIQEWGVQADVLDSQFISIIENDLDTPKAIQYLRAVEKDESLANRSSIFLFADKVLGLDLSRTEDIKPLSATQEDLLAQRDIARNEKKWSESDQLRVQLEETGLDIFDTPGGQKWAWR